MKRWYKVTVYNQSMEAIADLKNAFDISYDLRMNDLYTASFSLPADDSQTAYCSAFNYIEIYDGDRRVELFVIVETEKVMDKRKTAIRYKCVHVLWTLAWDLFFGYHDISLEIWTLKKDLSDEVPAQSTISSLAYDMTNEVLVAGTGKVKGQLWTSADGGDTWALKKDLGDEVPAQSDILSLTYDEANGVLVAGTHPDAQLWASADGGDTWTLKKDLSNEVPAQTIIYSLIYDAAHEVLVAGTLPDAQLWVSADGGDAWVLKKDLSAEVPAQTRVYALTYDSINEVLVAGTYPDGQIWASPDGGENWTLKKDLSNETPAQTRIDALGYDIGHEALVAGTHPDAQLWASADGGDTWTLKKDLSNETPAQTIVYAIVYDIANEVLIAGTESNAQLWASADGGDTWTLKKDLSNETPTQTTILALTYDAGNEALIAGTNPDAQLWRNSLVPIDILKYILAQQAVTRWQFGTCSFTTPYRHKFENINLIQAIWAVPEPFNAEWQFTFDTTSYPWTLNLVEASTDIAAHVVYRRNMKAVGWKQNFRNLITRLYPIGFGEGINQLTIENENPTGEKFIDIPTLYPQISGLLVDRAIEDEAVLYNEAVARLAITSVAPQQFTVDTIDLARLNKRDYLDPGDYVRIENEDLGIETSARVVRIKKRNVEKTPGKIDIEISEAARTLGGAMVGVATALSIEQTQAQGATNVLLGNFADNADPDHPAELRFPIWGDVIYVNKVLLSYRTEPYRSFTRVTESGTCETGNNSAPGDPHTHTVPDHEHDIIQAITEDANEPAAVTVIVDGRTVEGFGTDEEDRDITQYLNDYDAGRIVRGWHTITITPNDGAKVARIVASVFVQTYVQSRGGEKY